MANVVKLNTSDSLKKLKQGDNFLESIFDKVFIICQNDPHFVSRKKRIENLETTMAPIQERLDKQNKLLKQAKGMKQEVARKIKLLENENYYIRAELLEILGSEI